MESIDDYKDRFRKKTNEQLKNIVTSKFETNDTIAAKAALELLQERNNKGKMSLKEILNAPIPKLKEIIANPSQWSEAAVKIAEKQLFIKQYKTQTIGKKSSKTSINKKIFHILLMAMAAVIFWLAVYKLFLELIGMMMPFGN